MITAENLQEALVDSVAVHREHAENSDPLQQAGIDVESTVDMGRQQAEVYFRLFTRLLVSHRTTEALRLVLGAAWAEGVMTGVRAARGERGDV